MESESKNNHSMLPFYVFIGALGLAVVLIVVYFLFAL